MILSLRPTPAFVRPIKPTGAGTSPWSIPDGWRFGPSLAVGRVLADAGKACAQDEAEEEAPHPLDDCVRIGDADRGPCDDDAEEWTPEPLAEDDED